MSRGGNTRGTELAGLTWKWKFQGTRGRSTFARDDKETPWPTAMDGYGSFCPVSRSFSPPLSLSLSLCRSAEPSRCDNDAASPRWKQRGRTKSRAIWSETTGQVLNWSRKFAIARTVYGHSSMDRQFRMKTPPSTFSIFRSAKERNCTRLDEWTNGTIRAGSDEKISDRFYSSVYQAWCTMTLYSPRDFHLNIWIREQVIVSLVFPPVSPD